MGQGLVSSIMLLCGIAASLAIGVLLAYGLCVGMFAIFKIHSRQVAVVKAAAIASQAKSPRLEAQRS
jgi:hypothetical protein